MKPTNTFYQFRTQLLTILSRNDLYLSALVLLAVVVWFFGPNLTWRGLAPLTAVDKRIYVILFLCLMWLLKFLMFDTDAPDPFQNKDVHIRKKLHELQNRFDGALQFIKKTTVFRHGKTARLHTLPWYLLVGPSNAGKTSLLSHSDIHFILKRQQKQHENELPTPSKHCDWWITRDANIIDVPGNYLCAKETYPLLWQYFLRLIKKHRGKCGIDGILIAMPLPEILKQRDTKQFYTMMHDFLLRLAELKNLFRERIPCQLIITKCDLLPGFNEFFAESNKDEITQAWGINLHESKASSHLADLFVQRFNALIKKINQQLLSRIHQERNPMIRPYIKDFPLQVERLKEFTLTVMKKFATEQDVIALQGVYLVSALQPVLEKDASLMTESIHSSERSVQLFKEPSTATRAYFVKQLLTAGLAQLHSEQVKNQAAYIFKRRLIYATSLGAISLAAIVLGRDFTHGVQQTYTLQNTVTDYQLALSRAREPHEQLLVTLHLLNALHQSATGGEYKLNLAHLLSFYSDQSRQKAKLAYQEAIQTLLLPAIKNHFADYLTLPVNKNTEYVYAVLKAYLMLGDPQHVQAEFIANTLKETAPQSVSESDLNQLIEHVQLALHSSWKPLILDNTLINQTRNYFLGLQPQQLSYIILKNMHGNNNEMALPLIMGKGTKSVFTSQVTANLIPMMFTAKTFTTIISKDVTKAAEEALLGNWVLGNPIDKKPELALTLIGQLRNTYISNYINTWENLLANVDLSTPNDLAELDTILQSLISNKSPLLGLLQTLHDNTYFEPIISASPKLQSIGTLIEKNNQSTNQLYQIFTSLQALHQHIEAVLSTGNRGKGAFDVVATRMQQTKSGLDPITQLRLVAQRNPEPVKQWLEKIANNAWRLLMKDASHYIDTSYRQEVSPFYKMEIAGRYPFSTHTQQEVNLPEFVRFFGKTGIMFSFYSNYLQPFVDTSTPEWHWKTIDERKLPFNEDVLRQIQQAMNVHHTFFPRDDNQLLVQFTLQPYQFSNQIKRIKLTFNRKQFSDAPPNKNPDANNPHVIAWPSNEGSDATSIQFVLANKQTISRHFDGPWGWFKLISQSFETPINKKKILINLSRDQHAAKYFVVTNGEFNPFLSLNLHHFQLPDQLMQG